MFDVTNFLVRWLFLSNLVRDVAEIQTLPYNPQAQQIPRHRQSTTMVGNAHTEDEWKDTCLRGILSYPPGTQRLLVMDAMRQELVEQLAWSLHRADQVLDQYEMARRFQTLQKQQKRILHSSSSTATSPKSNQNILDGKNNEDNNNNYYDDPFLDADLEILKAFEKETLSDENENDTTAQKQQQLEQQQAVLVIANGGDEDGTNDIHATIAVAPTSKQNLTASPTRTSTASMGESSQHIVPFPRIDELEDAQRTIRTVRDYLPQLVSILLRSPPAFEPHLLNPIEKLRRLVIRRCVEDANWGVDVCWLLEAEVGRAWKTLFEHRQQTGRRLIVVLPAEKAAVLAKIGTEKREAFDLLQDAEQATAYGYTQPIHEDMFYQNPNQQYYQDGNPQDGGSDFLREPSRLPSSLSLRRCSHFGDTMHFIDLLTKISMDMRHVPLIHRPAFLKERLKEVNRRLRRRMVTLGDVSLDVEDNLGPDDWPHISDITTEMLGHSVHLPLDPRQQERWPGGRLSNDDKIGGVVRVLNIVVEECRTLSSRERCPFLVLVEVAETGLNGDDSRLYASGAPGLGATVEEALSMSATLVNSRAARRSNQRSPSYEIPSELLGFSTPINITSKLGESIERNVAMEAAEVLRAGWQSDETVYYPYHQQEMMQSSPYDVVRQDEYEQLHQQMYTEQNTMSRPRQDFEFRDPLLHTGEALLYKVFGQPWLEKCEEIRQSSPYGKTRGWRLASFIMKAGEDIRRESLVMQIIGKLNEWFQTEIPPHLRPHMRPYTIMCVGGDAGLVECLSDAKSIDEVKKQTDNFQSLRDYFERAYGPPTAHGAQYMAMKTGPPTSSQALVSFEEAQDNFLRSLVGYSLVCYILQIKDRHNANILLDRMGNIMHIDFGFVLGDSPKMAKVPIFTERAPFKLSTEFWEVLGGWDVNQGGLGVRFCHMFETAFACAASHTEEIVSLVEATMLTLTQSSRQARHLANGVRSRLKMRGPPGSAEQKSFIMELVNAAIQSWGTSTYDWLQKNMNGYQ